MINSEESFDRPPSDLRQLGTVAYYELYKCFRSARLAGIFALAALVIVLILVVPPALGQPYPKDAAYFAQRFIAWVNVLVVVGATLFAGDALASEFQNRTGYLMFPNPIKRGVFFAGKLTASLLTLFFVLAVYYLVVSVLTISHSGDLSDLTYRSFGLALLYASAATGIAYLISSIMKGTTGALVLTLAVLLLIFPIIDGVLFFAGVKPVISVYFSSGAISYIMQTPYPTDMQVHLPIRGSFIGSSSGESVSLWSYYPDVPIAAAVMVAYALVTVEIGRAHV
jgi:ABC-type transport system involved in multi-copper enzyme maturation permease subunit